jgi:hypothetical protein
MVKAFQPDLPFEQALQRATSDLGIWDELFQTQPERFWEAWVDSERKEMLGSPEKTAFFLSHQDPKVRIAALSLINSYWVSRELFADECLRLAFHDPDPCVRGGAFHALFRLYKYLNDPSGYIRKLLRAFIPEESLVKLTEEARQAVIDIEEAWRKRCEELAGGHLSDMLTGPKKAEAYLRDANPRLREAAIILMDNYYKQRGRLVAFYEECALVDPDLSVRMRALDQVIAHFDRTNDLRIGNYLATIVSDPSKEVALRRQAYEGLFALRGMPVEAMPTFRWGGPDFPFPESVDWSFVNSFRM